MQVMSITHLATLQRRIEDHKNASSSIGQHFCDKRSSAPKGLSYNFSILQKCKTNLTAWCLKCFLLNELRPRLNVQSDTVQKFLNGSFN